MRGKTSAAPLSQSRGDGVDGTMMMDDGVGVGGGDGEISRERRAVILIGAHNEPGFPPKRGFNLPR